MQVSYNLLKEYVEIDLSPDELAKKLSMNGIVAERISPIFRDINGVFVGKITKIQPGNKDNNLSICKVDIKSRELDIVCGARNIKNGDHVPVVIEGGYLPELGRIDGKTIQGVYSQGMICSASELGLEKSKSPGILIFDENTPIGESIENIRGIGDDVIFDFEIFSNRPDLMSIIGIAREIAALSGKPLYLPEIVTEESKELIADLISVEVKDEELCPRYSGRVIKGITVDESPFWLRWKLLLLGIRPISNIVDITNYIMMETGQPLHAFDLNYINGKKIIVRRAKDGERFTTLDSVERILTQDNLVIADTERAIALAGVMGGANSEIITSTEDIFLESAYFEPVNNRKTSSYFNMRTDASNRFEKGVDPFGQVFALNRAANLVLKLTHGKLAGGVIDQHSKTLKRPEAINLEISKINRVLGTKISSNDEGIRERAIDILTKLEFKIESDEDKNKNNLLKITPPSFRVDIKGDVDVIEEIARLYGYENISLSLFKSTLVQQGKSDIQKKEDRIRNVLVSNGMHQIISYSMISPKSFDWLKLSSLPNHYLCKAIKLANPLIQDHSIMRTTLIPGLLKAVQWNVNHSIDKIKLFEIGKVYFPHDKPERNLLPVEKIMITGGISKIGRGDIWEKNENWDIFYLKGILESIFDVFKIDDIEYIPGDCPFFKPQNNGLIKSRGNRLGIFGEIHSDITDYLGIPGRVFLFEVDFEEIYSLVNSQIYFKSLPKYPHIQRDLAIVVPEEISFEQIKKEVLEIDKDIIKRIELFDIFRGEQVKQGYKSIAFSIYFQSDDRTLTDIEVDKIMKNVTMRLSKLFKADLRL